MNYIYATIYWAICFVIFFIIFMKDTLFDLLFEKKLNNITDYNDPNYTGGFTYVFRYFPFF